MIRYFLLSFTLLVVLVVTLAGFRGELSPKPPLEIFNDMDHQPRFDPQHTSTLFADGRAARPPVPGTVPIGYMLDSAYYQTGGNNNRFAQRPAGFSGSTGYYDTGRFGDAYGDGIPLEITPELMARGRERFAINCAICHGAAGGGDGVVSKFGLNAIANFQQERIRTMPDGQIFNTITHGKNTMGPYGAQITVEDRWAIIAYIRALQRSQNATVDDIPASERAALEKPQEAAQPQ